MAYTSRQYQGTWSYEPSQNDFNARVGRILAGGVDLQASLRSKALDSLKSNLDFEKAEELNQRTSCLAMANPELLKPSTEGQTKRTFDTRGYVWVDPKGRTAGPVSTSGSDTADLRGPSTLRSTGPGPTERQVQYMSMDPTQRTMHQWRRINPGCIEATTRMPISTFKEHFPDKSTSAGIDSMDKTYNIKKTDFSHYTEVKLRLMSHIKSG